MTAVARGVQISGIFSCVTTGRELMECQCFIDLALAESREPVNQILIAGMSEGRPRTFGPRATPPVR